MEIKHKFYAVQEKEKENSDIDVVRLVATGNRIYKDEDCKTLGFFTTIYGRLSKVEQDEFELKQGCLQVVDDEGIIVAHLWDCYTYEQYKEVCKNKS